jgi:hypothetical protein
VTTTAAASRCGAGIIQNRKNLLRTSPSVYVNLFGLNTARGLQHFLVLTTTGAKLTLSVLGDFDSDHGCAEMCHIAKKIDWTLAVAIFHFAVRRIRH